MTETSRVTFFDKQNLYESGVYCLNIDYVDKLEVGDIVKVECIEYKISRIVKDINYEGYIIYIEKWNGD